MNIRRDDYGHVSLGQNYDINLLKIVTDEIEEKFGGKQIDKLLHPDTSYIDYELKDGKITIHYEHYTGVYLIPGYFFSDNKSISKEQKKKEDEIINQLERHFKDKYEHIKTK